MRGHTAPIGAAFMTLGALGIATLATVAATSDRSAGDWHKPWFLALISLCGFVVVAGLYIILCGAFHRLPPRSWTTNPPPLPETPPQLHTRLDFHAPNGFRVILSNTGPVDVPPGK